MKSADISNLWDYECWRDFRQKAQALLAVHTVIPASGSLTSVDGRTYLVPVKPIGVAALSGTTSSLGFYTPKADSMAKTPRPAHVGVAQWLGRGHGMPQVMSSMPAQNYQFLVEGQSCSL